MLEGTAERPDGVAAGRLRAGRAPTATPDVVLDRHRQRGRRVRRRRRAARPRTASPPGWCRCRRWELFERPDRRRTRTRCCRPSVPDARRRGRPPASAGSAGPTTSSASTASAPRRRGRSRSSKLGFTPDNVVDRARAARWTTLARRTGMTKLARPLRRAGPEPVARQPPARLAHRRRARALGRARHPGHHVEPHDLPEGDRRLGRLRRPVRRPGRRRRVGRATPTGRWSSPTSRTRCASCARCYDESGGGDGFVSVEVAPELARDTDGHRSRPPASCTSASPSRTCS